jgi:hypothetical protein
MKPQHHVMNSTSEVMENILRLLAMGLTSEHGMEVVLCERPDRDARFHLRYKGVVMGHFSGQWESPIEYLDSCRSRMSCMRTNNTTVRRCDCGMDFVD